MLLFVHLEHSEGPVLMLVRGVLGLAIVFDELFMIYFDFHF